MSDEIQRVTVANVPFGTVFGLVGKVYVAVALWGAVAAALGAVVMLGFSTLGLAIGQSM